jgi:hypothetical protein
MAETKTIVNQQTTRIITKAADVVVVQGQKGETGAQGQAGSDGVGIVSLYALNGFVYASLSDGRDIKIAELPRGPQGPTGPQGAAGTNGLDGEDGVGIIDAGIVDGDLYLEMTDGIVYNVGPVVGPQGPQGPTGAKGDKGDPGATGLQGPAGPTGAQGPAGVDGADGAQGPAGVSVASANIDQNNHLILTLSDATTVDAGELPAGSGGGSDWLTDAPVGHLLLLPELPTNGKWIARDGAQQPSTSYPELAGKTGYPLISIPDSYANVAAFTSPHEIKYKFPDFGQTLTLADGTIIINALDMFIYSKDAGATWQTPAFLAENQISWGLFEHAGKLYATSSSTGSVHIYNSTTMEFLYTVSISSGYTTFSIVYDDRAGLFYAVGVKVVSTSQSRRYGVFESVDGQTWTFKYDVNPGGVTESTLMSRIFITEAGFVVVNTIYARNTMHTVHFYPDMDSAHTEHAVPTGTGQSYDNFFANGAVSGNVVLLLSQSRQYRSVDGGQTFEEFFPTGLGTSGWDLVSIGNGGWIVASTADGIRYSKNDGDTWVTYAASALTSPDLKRLALDADDNVFAFSNNTNADTCAKFLAFKPADADFRVPTLTPPDSSASWFVKAKP